MRTYTFLAGGIGTRRGFDFWPARTVTSNARIRTVSLVLFRKWFGGRAPTKHWHMDGFMAEASDGSGNTIQVEQVNHTYRGPGQTLMRRPLCPMVIKKGAAR